MMRAQVPEAAPGRFIEELTCPEAASRPACQSRRAYPGNRHLSADTFVRVLTELLEGFIDRGARRIGIVNTGVSTEGPNGLAARGSLDRRGIRIGVADIRRLGHSADHLLQQKTAATPTSAKHR